MHTERCMHRQLCSGCTFRPYVVEDGAITCHFSLSTVLFAVTRTGDIRTFDVARRAYYLLLALGPRTGK